MLKRDLTRKKICSLWRLQIESTHYTWTKIGMHFQQHSVYFYVQNNCVSNTIEMCDNPRLTAFYNPYSIFMQTIVIYKMFCIKSLRFYFLSQIFGTQYLYFIIRTYTILVKDMVTSLSNLEISLALVLGVHYHKRRPEKTIECNRMTF